MSEAAPFPPAPTDDLGELVEVGPVRLWCAQEGTGPPLVLLGGFTAGHYIFDLVWRALRERFRLIAVEPRGLGASDRPDPSDTPYDVDTWAQDLHDLLDVVGVGTTSIWAQGFSSYYALRFAARWPERVAGLAAYTDVWAGDPGKGYDGIWDVYRTVVERFGTRGFGARMLAHLFEVTSPAWFYPWEQRNIEATLHPDTAAATVGYCLTEADVRDDLEHVAAPVLVLQGDQDWRGAKGDPEHDASLALMRERIEQLEVATVPDTHPGYVLIQQPDACVDRLGSFLERAAVGRG